MKSEKEIRDEIIKLQKHLKDTKMMYSCLEGNPLVTAKTFNKIRGKIKALEWVLEETCPQCGKVKDGAGKFCFDCTVSKHLP